MRFDQDRESEKWRAAGAGAGIVSLPVPHTPAPLAGIADALREVAMIG